MSEPLYLVTPSLIETLVSSLPLDELQKLKEALDFAVEHNSREPMPQARVFCNESGTSYKVLIACPITGDYELLFHAGK